MPKNVGSLYWQNQNVRWVKMLFAPKCIHFRQFALIAIISASVLELYFSVILLCLLFSMQEMIATKVFVLSLHFSTNYWRPLSFKWHLTCHMIYGYLFGYYLRQQLISLLCYIVLATDQTCNFNNIKNSWRAANVSTFLFLFSFACPDVYVFQVES